MRPDIPVLITAANTGAMQQQNWARLIRAVTTEIHSLGADLGYGETGEIIQLAVMHSGPTWRYQSACWLLMLTSNAATRLRPAIKAISDGSAAARFSWSANLTLEHP